MAMGPGPAPLGGASLGPVGFARIEAAGRPYRSRLVGLLLGDQAADPLGEQGAVERLLEGVVEAQVVDVLGRLVAGEGDEDRRDVVLALAEVLGDLPGLDPADGQVDDDAVRVEALGPDAGLEARGGGLDPEVVPLAEVLFRRLFNIGASAPTTRIL